MINWEHWSLFYIAIMKRPTKLFLCSTLVPAFVDRAPTDLFAAAMSTAAHRTAASSYGGPHAGRENSNRAAVIWLHGLGDNTDGWKSLKETLPDFNPRLGNEDITYVFPKAPTRGITINGGEQMPSWFDLYDWPIDLSSRDDHAGQLEAVRQIEEAVEMLKEEEGIPASRIVVGGFAQGGAVAMLSAYCRRNRDEDPFAGCVCLSGWLPMRDKVQVSEETAEYTPLFWAHGKYDNKIKFENQVRGVNQLRKFGVDVSARAYPVGHESSNNEEIEAMAEFLDDVLYPKVDIEDFPPPPPFDVYEPEFVHSAPFVKDDVQFAPNPPAMHFASYPNEPSSAEFLATLKYLMDLNDNEDPLRP